MTAGERFGEYWLLTRVGSDEFGQAFCACVPGRDGGDKLLLLKAFDGARVDRSLIGQVLSERAQVQSLLDSPFVAQGAGAGRHGETPYVAYDYVPGRQLSDLLAEAFYRDRPVDPEIALTLCDGIVRALAVGRRARFREEPVRHDLLIPGLVRLTATGQVVLLGFEVAPALRQLAVEGAFGESVVRYVAPEARAGEAAHDTDGPYALGALLYELLTGQPVPTRSQELSRTALSGLQLAGGAGPLPSELVDLLARSLCAAESRIPNIVEWHRPLSQFMREQGFRATNDDLSALLQRAAGSALVAEKKAVDEARQEVSSAIAAAADVEKAAPARPARAATPEPTPTPPATSIPVRH